MSRNKALAYESVLQKLNEFDKMPMKLGLERIEKLLENHKSAYKRGGVFHVAGTNGKGTVATTIAKILEYNKYSVGLYTSPEIISDRDRIKINGADITKARFVARFNSLLPQIEHMISNDEIPTKFEILTAMALTEFHFVNTNFVALEVGLGGRLDATNILSDCSNPPQNVKIITNISYDHMEFLGNTLAEIATEKCGIIRENSIVISSPTQPNEAMQVIKKICHERNCELIMPNLNELKNVEMSISGAKFEYRGMKFRTKLVGNHQIINIITAIEAVLKMRHNPATILTEEGMYKGIRAVKIPGRFERIDSHPIIFDGAHNKASIQALTNTLKEICVDKISLIFGAQQDKEYEEMLEIVAPICERIICVKLKNSRVNGVSAANLKQIASKFCKNVQIASDVESAIETAKAKLNPVIIAGSLSLLSKGEKS